MQAQTILTVAISQVTADKSSDALSRIIHIEMLFSAKRHLRDARLAELQSRLEVSK